MARERVGRRVPDPDGMLLLTSSAVEPVLIAAVESASGRLLQWSLDHVDAQPKSSTTATYTATVEWPHGVRQELLGVTARVGGPGRSDSAAQLVRIGERDVSVWLYPRDPELPGLTRATYPEEIASLLVEYGVYDSPIAPERVRLDLIGYRPRRRAVVKATVSDPEAIFFVKVLRAKAFEGIRLRHELLLEAGVPGPQIAAATPDFLLVLRRLPGRPLAEAIFDEADPCTGEQLVALMDSIPDSVASLKRRRAWSDSVDYYADLVAQNLPELEARLSSLVATITGGLAGLPLGVEPTHGDFHEGQLFVSGGRISGVLDVDTIGPGRRADDLACLIGHLSTIQHMNAAQAAQVSGMLAKWVPVFDERVDPIELRLRTAAVVISLSTGPYRAQEDGWGDETLRMIETAEALVRQAG